jgi:hypothetical protein
MKDLTQLRKHLAYRPFRPFYLETIGGTKIQVERAEWFVEAPGLPDQFVVFHPTHVTVGLFSDLTDLIEVKTPTAPSEPMREFPRAEFRAPD